jgi:transcription antitermination factor NusG
MGKSCGTEQRELCPDSGSDQAFPVSAMSQSPPSIATEPSTEEWLAVTVKPKHEKLASVALRNKGCEEFLPLYRVRNRWSDRVKEVELPLFPGYLFCRPRRMHPAHILATLGVKEFVEFGAGPAPIPAQEIQVIRTLVDSGLPLGPMPFLKVGQRVRIARGALRDVEGILLELKDDLRLVVSMNLLQRSVAVTIDRDFLI